MGTAMVLGGFTMPACSKRVWNSGVAACTTWQEQSFRTSRCARMPVKEELIMNPGIPRSIKRMMAETLSLVCRVDSRSEEHTSELQSHVNLVCRLLLEKKNRKVCQE